MKFLLTNPSKMRTLGAPDGSHITIIQRNGVHKAIAMVSSIIIPFSNSSDMISHHATHSRRVRFSEEVLHCYCPERTTSAAVKRSLYYDADNFSKMRKDATATAYSRYVRDGGIKLRRMCVSMAGETTAEAWRILSEIYPALQTLHTNTLEQYCQCKRN